ncbi:hypothetical protein EW026_g7056 [Hermanssonia centrifuga]|uniref:CcmS related domain-containing protein n=1 Tax=Hermanssonia centrifuga TaxID=98765 RepID=A0A4V3X9J4_9APHY|nr:hypothetical protein EW026_g7056 [Hermanssonia centrifuga]
MAKITAVPAASLGPTQSFSPEAKPIRLVPRLDTINLEFPQVTSPEALDHGHAAGTGEWDAGQGTWEEPPGVAADADGAWGSDSGSKSAQDGWGGGGGVSPSQLASALSQAVPTHHGGPASGNLAAELAARKGMLKKPPPTVPPNSGAPHLSHAAPPPPAKHVAFGATHYSSFPQAQGAPAQNTTSPATRDRAMHAKSQSQSTPWGPPQATPPGFGGYSPPQQSHNNWGLSGSYPPSAGRNRGPVAYPGTAQQAARSPASQAGPNVMAQWAHETKSGGLPRVATTVAASVPSAPPQPNGTAFSSPYAAALAQRQMTMQLQNAARLGLAQHTNPQSQPASNMQNRQTNAAERTGLYQSWQSWGKIPERSAVGIQSQAPPQIQPANSWGQEWSGAGDRAGGGGGWPGTTGDTGGSGAWGASNNVDPWGHHGDDGRNEDDDDGEEEEEEEGDWGNTGHAGGGGWDTGRSQKASKGGGSRGNSRGGGGWGDSRGGDRGGGGGWGASGGDGWGTSGGGDGWGASGETGGRGSTGGHKSHEKGRSSRKPTADSGWGTSKSADHGWGSHSKDHAGDGRRSHPERKPTVDSGWGHSVPAGGDDWGKSSGGGWGKPENGNREEKTKHRGLLDRFGRSHRQNKSDSEWEVINEEDEEEYDEDEEDEDDDEEEEYDDLDDMYTEAGGDENEARRNAHISPRISYQYQSPDDRRPLALHPVSAPAQTTSFLSPVYGHRRTQSTPAMPAMPLPEASMTMNFAADRMATNFDLVPNRGRPGENRIVFSQNAALLYAKRALYSTRTRPAKERIHWMFNPNRDPRVQSLIRWVLGTADTLAIVGLQKFLETRQRGALFTNADFRVPSAAGAPIQPAFDWINLRQLSPTLDRKLQKSVICYNPATHVVVFVFLLSKSGNSMAIWRKKVAIPEQVRLAYKDAITLAVEGLPKDLVVYVDELPPPPEEPPKKKRSWWRRLFRLK